MQSDLSELFVKRLEDKIVAVRIAASDCLRTLLPHMVPDRGLKLERRLRVLASEDPRPEVRSVALRCLPNTSESAEVIVERTGDFDGSVRTFALQRAVELPLDVFSVESVHIIVNNAYTAALTYEASSTSTLDEKEDVLPLEKSEGRDFAFSVEFRRRREEQALLALMEMLLSSAQDNLWAFLNWLPLDANPQACLYILHALFARGLSFPEDFSSREMREPLDTHKNIAVAVVFCERLAKQPNGQQSIEDLVPEPMDVCGEFETTQDVSSSKTFLLLKLCKYLDYSDESGRSAMEATLLELLKKKPQMPIVKLVLANLRIVQNVVQKYTESIVTVILSHYLDYTNEASWDAALSVTAELLASLPLVSTEFAALARIEEDILTPAKKPVSELLDQALVARYTKCIGALGRFISRTRDEHFDDLCFWVTNTKKSYSLRAASITVLVDWFLLPNVTLTGAMTMQSFAEALLKIIVETQLSAPLTFAALAGLLRLLFSNQVKADATISQFLQLAFLKMTQDARLKALLTSFFPTWASYPESRPIIADGFLHLIRHFPEDIPGPHRKLIWRYILRLIFEHSTQMSEVGNYNFLIAKKCLKTVYSNDRTDPMEILKELDFVGLGEQEKQQLDRMLGKVVTKYPVHGNVMNRILGLLLNPAEMKNRKNAKFPEPPQKKEKPTHVHGRASLDSEAHLKLSKTHILQADLTKRSKKRSSKEMDPAPEDDTFDSPSATQVARDAALARLQGQYEELDDYQLTTAAENSKSTSRTSKSVRGAPTPTKTKSSTTTRTPTRKTSSTVDSKPQRVPQTEPRPKRPKLAEEIEDDDGLTDTNALLQQLEFRLGGNATALAKIKDLSNMVSKPSPSKSSAESETKRKLVSKRNLGGKMMDLEDDIADDDDFTTEAPLAKSTRSNKMQMDLEDDIIEPSSSRPKRGRTSSKTVEDPPSTPSRRSSRLIPASTQPKDDESDDDEAMAPPTTKRSKRSASPSDESPLPSQSRTTRSSAQKPGSRVLEVNRSTTSDESSQKPSSRPKRGLSATPPSSIDASTSVRKAPLSAEEASKIDWKKQHFPALSAPSGPVKIGLLGYASHSDESNRYIEKLQAIEIEAEEVNSFDPNQKITHLVVRAGETSSRTSCTFAIHGVWIMNAKWLDQILDRGEKISEKNFGARITKSVFSGQHVYFSPQLTTSGPMKRLAQTMVKEGGGSITINSNKAHFIVATNDDDISFLIEQFDNMPILSVSTLVEDSHKYV